MLHNFQKLASKLTDIKKYFGPQYQGVVVAHSGGADSTALFHLLWQMTKAKKNFQLAIFHVNYGLRGSESDEDAAFSKAMAEQAEVPFFAREVSESERQSRRGESLQEWARHLRYHEFARLAADGWLIALAHHQDDLAENVLMRLSRGSSAGNLAGMQEFEAPYWRPLLYEKKADLLAYLDAHKIPHREDSSNAKMDYSRNSIRHRVLPELEKLYPGASSRIAACALEAEDVAAWCKTELRGAMLDHEQRGLKLGTFLRQLSSGVALIAIAARLEPLLSWRHMSRQLLMELVEALMAMPSKGLVRSITPSTRVVVRDGELKVENAPLPAKTARQEQHDKGLGGDALGTLLEDNSYAIFKVNKGLLSINRGRPDVDQSDLGALSLANALDVANLDARVNASLDVRVYAAGSRKTLRFRGLKRSWRLRTLLQLWRIDPRRRKDFLVVECNSDPIGMFDGETISVPAADGSRLERAELKDELRIELRPL